MALTLLATTDVQIIRVVEALYNQKPGYTYLQNFKTYVTDNSMAVLANTLVGSGSDETVATTIVTNLGLTGELSTTGIAYLTAQFAANPTARGQVVLDTMDLLAGLESDATWGATAARYNANVVASYEYSAVSTNTSVGVVGAGSTYTLTNLTNTLIGTSGDDTFQAAYDATNGMSFQSADTIDGGEGTGDSLNITVGAVGTHQAASVINTEIVKGTFTAAGTISLLGTTGVTSVNASGSTDVASFTNIALGAELTVENTASNATLAYKTSEVTGTTDSATLNLKNVTAGTVTVAGIETLAIASSSGGNVLTALTAAAATTLNISGDQTLNLGAANTVATTINASTMTAALTLISDNAAATTITGGAGNDVITLTGTGAAIETIDAGAGNDTITYTANLGATDTINGGEGTDTLVSTFALLDGLTVPIAGALITNIEAASVSNAVTTGAQSITLANIQAGLETLTFAFAHTSTALNDNTLEVVGTTATTVNIGASLAANATILGGNVTVTDTGTGTTDSVTVNNTGINSTTGANLDIWGTATLTSTGYESVTLSTGTGTGAVTNDLAALTITPDATTANVSLTLTGTNPAVLATAGVVTTSTGVLTIDASALTAQAVGVNSFTLATTTQGVGGTAVITGTAGEDSITVGNFASTITGGDGIDTIVGGTAADTISGGAGNDLLTGSGGNDTISGGDGNDVITATVAGNYTVTGGAGDDTLDLGDTVTQADSFDGGDGTDTLILSNTSVTAINALSVSNINTFNAGLQNIERLDFGALLAQNVDLGRIDNISDVILGNMASSATISGVGATNNFEIQATTGSTLTVTLGTATGTSDVVNINLDSNAAIGSGSDGITAANVETINIVGDDKTATNASDINVLTLVATKATTINVSGHDGLTLTNTGNTKVTTFDASGVVGTNALATDTAANMAVTFVSANTSTTAVVTITGGEGADALTGNLSIDTITGGLGNDTITITAGNDVIDGGAGDDTFAFTEALMLANSGTTATLAGGAGTDTISMEAATINVVDADFRGITSIETFAFVSGTSNVVMASGADATGIVTITGGSGADTINLSSTDFDNTVTITGGDGADVITLSTSDSSSTLVITDAGAGVDTVTNFTVGAGTGTDQIDLSFVGMNDDAGGNEDVDWVNIDLSTSSIAAGDAIVLSTVTGAFNCDALTTDTNILILNLAANIADTTALQAAIDTGGGLAMTVDGILAAKDAFLVAYDDGTDSYLAHVENTTQVADNGLIGNGAMTTTVIMTFLGVADVATLTAANFDIIA